MKSMKNKIYINLEPLINDWNCLINLYEQKIELEKKEQDIKNRIFKKPSN